jgi:hypothetical protein
MQPFEFNEVDDKAFTFLACSAYGQFCTLFLKENKEIMAAICTPTPKGRYSFEVLPLHFGTFQSFKEMFGND